MKAILLVALYLLCLFSFAAAELQSSSSSEKGDFSFHIVQTTDIHGWVTGHIHEPRYSADFGDFRSFLHFYKQEALAGGNDFFLFDSGDFPQGTGLSDATPITGEDLFPIIEKIPYDAVTIGNHELSGEANVDFLYDTFVQYWNGSYLSTNVYYIDSEGVKHRFGTPYKVIQSDNGANVLVFGILYTFDLYPDNSEVIPVNETLESQEFADMMDIEDIDLIVCLAHIGARSAETNFVREAIRQFPNHATTPLVILAGHTHMMQWVTFTTDPNTVILESGWGFKVLGLLNLTISNGAIESVSHKFLDNAVDSYKSALLDPSSYEEQPEGIEIKDMLVESINELQLNDTIGCSPKTFAKNKPLQDEDSIFHFYCDMLYPKMYFSLLPDAVLLLNTGSVRYSLYEGDIVRNDVFVIDPFNSTFYYFKNFTGKLILDIMHALGPWKSTAYIPHYYLCPYVYENMTYNLVASDYDTQKVIGYLNETQYSGSYEYFKFPSKYSSIENLENYIAEYMQCPVPPTDNLLDKYKWLIYGAAIIAVVCIVVVVVVIVVAVVAVFYFKKKGIQFNFRSSSPGNKYSTL